MEDPIVGAGVADRSHSLILEALGRAAVAPAADGLPLLAAKGEAGLFPATAQAKPLADRCKDQGWLETVRTEAKGKNQSEFCRLTEKGRHYLLEQVSPKHLLEDYLRTLEGRQDDIEKLTRHLDQMRQSLANMQTMIAGVLPALAAPLTHGASMNGTLTTPVPKPAAPKNCDRLIAEIKQTLAEWHAAAVASEDCPLPELFRRVGLLGGAASIGQFHDSLRQLDDDRQVYLHPWTAPLYAMPEPSFALMIGHEIAYYASLR